MIAIGEIWTPVVPLAHSLKKQFSQVLPRNSSLEVVGAKVHSLKWQSTTVLKAGGRT